MPQGRKAAFRLLCWLAPVLPGINGLFRLALKDRNDPAYAANVMSFAQQTDWVDGEDRTVPSTQLVCDWLAKAKLRYLNKLLEQLRCVRCV